MDNDSDMTATLVKASAAASTLCSCLLQSSSSSSFFFSLRARLLDFFWLQVDSANKYGTLLEVVQVLTDLKLTINRAYISSDGEWFMDGECRAPAGLSLESLRR